MEDKELINKLKELKNIEPSKDWALSTKVRILGEVPNSGFSWNSGLVHQFIFGYNKIIFAAVALFGMVAGSFTIAQNSLPGDPFYALKKFTESCKMAFVSDEDLPMMKLELANQKLEELNEVAQSNQSKKLASAIQEAQASISNAAKEIIKVQESDVQDIVSETKKVQENKEKIESLGIEVGDNTDLDSALVQLIQREIDDLQVNTLTEEQKETFNQAVEDFKAGNYSDALEKILLLSNPNK
jgi:vacuolar-type H+-ATPase subunit I/STV1